MPGVGNNYFVLKNVKIPCAPSVCQLFLYQSRQHYPQATFQGAYYLLIFVVMYCLMLCLVVTPCWFCYNDEATEADNFTKKCVPSFFRNTKFSSGKKTWTLSNVPQRQVLAQDGFPEMAQQLDKINYDVMDVWLSCSDTGFLCTNLSWPKSGPTW